MQQFIVRDKEAGRRLDQYIQKLLPEAGTSFIYKMLRKKNITVNHKKADGNIHLSSGDSIEMFFSEETFEKLSGGVRYSELSVDQDKSVDVSEYINAYKKLNNIEIVYESDDFIFVDKPVGVLSQKANPDDYSLNEWLIGYLLDKGEITASQIATFKPAFCNRLDRNTTGIVLGGKSLQALRLLSEKIKNRTISKYYKTRVMGLPDSLLPVEQEQFFTDRAYLVKNKKTNQVKIYKSIEGARADNKAGSRIDEIYTGFRLLEKYSDQMLLEVELHTGKTHQIRAHLSYLGHPIIGDPKYGDGYNSYQELKAYRVVFPHMEECPELSGKEIVC